MKAIIIITGVIGSLALSSCNTFSGVGKDVQSAGRGIDYAAEQTSDAIDGSRN